MPYVWRARPAETLPADRADTPVTNCRQFLDGSRGAASEQQRGDAELDCAYPKRAGQPSSSHNAPSYAPPPTHW